MIANILVREQGVESSSAADVPDDVTADTATGWYTQANLSILVDRAATIAAREDRDIEDDLAGYLRRATSTYRVDTARTERMSYLAAAQASNTELLPPGFVIRKDAPAEAPKPQETNDVGPSGRGGW